MDKSSTINEKTWIRREPDPNDDTCIVITIHGVAPPALRPVKPFLVTGSKAIDEIRRFAARMLSIEIVHVAFDPALIEGDGIGDA